MASPREPTLALELATATLDHHPATAIARLWKPNSAKRDCPKATLRLRCPAICTFPFPRRKRALLSNSSTFWATNPSSSRCRYSSRLRKGVSTWFTRPAVSPELHFVLVRRFSVLPVGRPLTAQRSQRPPLVSKPMHATNPCKKWLATSPP